MSGVKFLLDTNVILGMLKSTPDVMSLVVENDLMANQCAFSIITRMELLGYPGITNSEDALIRQRLEQFTCIGITPEIENLAIELRRARRIKLPDALIAATAISQGWGLLTLDQGLMSVVIGAH